MQNLRDRRCKAGCEAEEIDRERLVNLEQEEKEKQIKAPVGLLFLHIKLPKRKLEF